VGLGWGIIVSKDAGTDIDSYVVLPSDRVCAKGTHVSVSHQKMQYVIVAHDLWSCTVCTLCCQTLKLCIKYANSSLNWALTPNLTLIYNLTLTLTPAKLAQLAKCAVPQIAQNIIAGR